MIRSIRAYGKTIKLYDIGNGKISQSMRRGRLYEQVLLDRFYRQKFNSRVLDIGANIGNHTLWLAIVCELPVIAFEPVYTEQLRANLTLNKVNNVEVVPLALGAQSGTTSHRGQGRLTDDGEQYLSDPQGPDVASGLFGDVGKTILIEPLDSWNLTDVAMMKIDVEGMEADVLRGAQETIKASRPAIYAEVWDDDHHRDIASVLQPLGYRLVLRHTLGTPIEEWRPA